MKSGTQYTRTHTLPYTELLLKKRTAVTDFEIDEAQGSSADETRRT